MGFNTRDGAMFSYDYSPPYKRVPLPEVAKKAALDYLLEEGNSLILATTTPNQKDAVQALRAVGFKRVTTTPSNEGRYNITLWQWKRPREKKHGRKETKV